MKSILTKILSALLILSLAAPAINPVQAQEQLELGAKVTDELTEDKQSQLYHINLDEAGKLTINLSTYFEYAKVIVYDENNDVALRESAYGGKEDNPFKLIDSVKLEPGEYTIEIAGGDWGDTTGEFALSTIFTPSENNEAEPNNGTELAQLLTSSETVKGFISWNDTEDYYKFDLKEAGTLKINISSYFEHMKYSLVDENGDPVNYETIYGGKDNNPFKYIDSADLEPGIYYMSFSGGDWGEVTGAYTISTEFIPAENLEQESNNGTEIAQPILLNNMVDGFISWNDNEDYYKFSLSKTSQITFAVSSFFENMNFEVLEMNNDALISTSIYGGKDNNPTKWGKEMEFAAGTYFVKISQGSYGKVTGKYRLTVNDLTEVKNFKDVSGKYIDPVNYLVEKQIASGLSDSIFGVNVTIKRVDAAVMIAKALKLNLETNYDAGFKDVPVRAQKAVNALVENGVISGKAKDRFGSNENLTRGEMALILTRAYQLDGDGVNISFKDVTERYEYAVQALIKNEITQGKTDTLFGTTNPITRGEMAIFLYRVENRY